MYYLSLNEGDIMSDLQCWTMTVLLFSVVCSSFGALTLLAVLAMVTTDDLYGREFNGWIIGGPLLVCIAFLIAGILALIGMKKRRALMLPHIVLETCFSSVLFVLTVYVLCSANLSAAAALMIIFAVNVHTAVVACKHYNSKAKPLKVPSNPPQVVVQSAKNKIQNIGHSSLFSHPPAITVQPGSDLPPPYYDSAVSQNEDSDSANLIL